MQRLIKFLKTNYLILLLIVLTIPSFFRMLMQGMYSTQDFHLFRLVEFDKCVKSLQIPCRWAPDAGLGYGEPLFNFYGQFSYLIGEIYHLLGGGFIDSIKFTFIISLVASAISMYFLSKSLWKNNWAALASSALYVYAPYRALDVWVRGALPEALAFVFFPLIILSIEKKSIKWLALLIALLIITHNLSFVMFLPVILIWIVYRKFWKGLWAFGIAALLSAFYTLPVIFESKYIDIESTIRGYFDFHNHYATLNQLFLSNFWGYGASQWGPVDDLSLSIGYLQWVVPLITLVVLFIKKELARKKEFLLLVGMAWIYIFLTHNKSTFIWELLPFMSYIQFPWRFLGVIVFCFSLASGVLLTVFNKKGALLFVLISLSVIILNVSFFRPDIWYEVSDEYYLTGTEWDRQRTASIGDFWPNFGHEIPDSPSDGKYINYFPGWVSSEPPKDGLILTEGSVFKDTPIRKLGNIISLLSIVGLVIFSKKWLKNT